MAQILMVSWDGAGNLVPTLGIARELVRAGHHVRLLGSRSTKERCADTGARFRPYATALEWDALDVLPQEEEMAMLADGLMFSPDVARDVLGELDREQADVVIVDCMMFTAVSAAQAAGVPTITLFHTVFSLFRDGPLIEMMGESLPALNAVRAEIGLGSVQRFGDVHDACALSLVAVPAEFEPAPADALNVRHIGPALDAPPLVRTADDVDVSDGTEPMVLVSLSTTYQDQAALLQTLADAVSQMSVRGVITTGPAVDPASITAGANTQVVRYVPHAQLLPSVSLVITHAGLGTVMASLGAGVPLLCIPMGRDQFLNAEQVQGLGAGRMLMPDADARTIADTATSILDDAEIRAGAKHMATVIGTYGGPKDAVAEIEALLSR